MLGLVLVPLLAAVAVGEDWPQWRGSQRDGVVREAGLLEELPDGPLPRAWTQPVGWESK